MSEYELTWEEWKTFGVLLKKVRRQIIEQITSSSTKSKARPIQRRLKHIDTARSIFDDIVFEQFPERSTQELCRVIYTHED